MIYPITRYRNIANVHTIELCDIDLQVICACMRTILHSRHYSGWYVDKMRVLLERLDPEDVNRQRSRRNRS